MNGGRWTLLTVGHLLAIVTIPMGPSPRDILWILEGILSGLMLLPIGWIEILLGRPPSLLFVILNSICWGGLMEFILSRFFDRPKDSLPH